MVESVNNISVDFKSSQLLYIKDETVSQEDTVSLLSTAFDNILIASNGEDALKIFQENEIYIVIADINMSKSNSIELIEEIKKNDKSCGVIVLSQHNEVDLLLKIIQLNVDGYILKPFNSKELLDTLEKVVAKLRFKCEVKNHKYYLEQYLSLLDKSGVISKTDTEGIITYVNDSFCKISGYKKEELLGQKYSILRDYENTNNLYEKIWESIKEKDQPWEGVIQNKSKFGSSYYMRTIITPIKDINGKIVEYVEVTDNLNAIVDDKKYLFNKIEENELSILVLLQIDEFDMLEKFYKIPTVDQVEKNFAFNLLSYLPKEYKFENVYSLGNGNFALLTEFNKFDDSKIDINKYLNNFVDIVKNSNLEFDDMEFDINITLSYAIGKYMLYEDAKEGLNSAVKTKSKVNFSNDFSIIASKEAQKNLEMIKTMKIALDSYNIVSYFQPIINNQTKKVEKYESLVRLIDENGEILSPFHFLNISKKGNYYNKITQRVLDNSFKILHTINTKLSINISARDIEKKETREYIFKLLKEYKDDTHRIIFELLEDENIEDFNIIKNFIQTVKAQGVKIAIDDFGTGYSNFERILEFEPDIVKIDGSLIKNIEDDIFSRSIVETIVLFAKKQNIETIAEYVENESIFNILNGLGVDYSQGYYFGKPEEI